jgi:beta-glucosidase-like glycosyl hydrolase
MSGGAGGNGGANPNFPIPKVTWPSAACQTKTTTLLGMMTKAEKAGQLVMAGNSNASPPAPADVTTLAPGAVFSPGGASPPGGVTPQNWAAMTDSYVAAAAATRLKIPALYGVDAVHGMNAASGAVVFPHNAGLGCSQDPALVQEVARITALEASAMGVTWTFAPVVSVSFDDRWGRVYESFSEDPALTGLLSAAATMGLQGATGLGTGKPGIVGCSKHWAGDGQAKAGTSAKGGVVDRGDIQVDEATLRKFGIAPYLQAIDAGLGSIMVSDATWNKMSLTSSKHVIVDILKTELGFKGFVATDWNAANSAGGVVNVINSGVDMLMQPDDWKGTIAALQTGVPDDRLNDAVTRILNVKCEAGLFEYQRDNAALASVGSAEHRAVGRVDGRAQERQQRAAARQGDQGLGGWQRRQRSGPPVRRLDDFVARRRQQDDRHDHRRRHRQGRYRRSRHEFGRRRGDRAERKAVCRVPGRQPDAQHAAARRPHAGRSGAPSRQEGRRHRDERPARADSGSLGQRRRLDRGVAARHRGRRRGRRALRHRQTHRQAQP